MARAMARARIVRAAKGAGRLVPRHVRLPARTLEHVPKQTCANLFSPYTLLLSFSACGELAPQATNEGEWPAH